jgi:type IV secretory pathway TrbD component
MARRTPTFQCLSKPILLGGCERTPAILVVGAALLCAVLAWFSWSLLALSAACVLGLAGLPLLQSLAKRDPMMVEIALRYFSYQRHYGAYPVRKVTSARQPGPVIGAILLGTAALIGAVVTL